ncbi:GNAT family N-acetyltransferase [Mesorhizobium sp. YC-39]|uniref:GNAT family N-acetyltransferase n=1 Tax=unclassified Mesorhizobium TaxID=325217 RepID=UPI0021E9965D|nr:MULTISPECIES: GNAT family N-acetyltransferase [unclassified Mesorhizobium]MCV3211905.1 GNAT family N-acetyltransferase [Mesorhizobium sp. YC-2]MCV3233628.1 GNAT family N-acetyltransferase [Mesorhizobium sp. YC-39]
MAFEMKTTKFRDLSGMPEFRAAEALQRAVWGDASASGEMIMVVQAEGGLAAGAFVDSSLVGFVFGFPSATPGIQYCHALAVLPEMRGRGIGLALKWYERRWCLTRGFRHVRWTFDPMQAVNAALYINRLGAGSTKYLVDYYGTSGGINEELPSDRLLVDWFLDHYIVNAKSERRFADEEVGDCLRIRLPRDVESLMPHDKKRTLTATLALRESLCDAFSNGYRISGFDCTERAYILAEGDR